MELYNLTVKQKGVYDYILKYMSQNERSPYIREIQDACRITSYKGTVDKLLALEKKGYIKRSLNKHRGIELNNIGLQKQTICKELES